MKKLVLFLSGIIAFMQMQAQSQYGTPLIEGSISVMTDAVYEEYCKGILIRKTESNSSYQTQLTGICISDAAFGFMKNSPTGMRGVVSLNNFSTTLKEGEVYNKNNDVPRFLVSVEISSRKYGQSPCKYETECSQKYKAVAIENSSCSGILKHHDIADVKVFCGITGVENCSRYLFLTAFYDAGAYSSSRGLPESPVVKGTKKYMICEEVNGQKREVWKSDEAKSSGTQGDRELTACVLTLSNDGSSGWTGSNGVYTSIKTDEDGNKTLKELKLMRLDTAQVFRYIREKPSFMTFNASGYYSEEYIENETGRRRKSTQNIMATLILGKVPEAEVELAGCFEVGEREQSTITATGKPEGGTYRFWSEPMDLVSIQQNGSTATVTGFMADRGTLNVEYTSLEGKKVKAAKPLTCIRVNSYNNGQPAPKIGLYNADGKITTEVKKMPISIVPSEASVLLKFEPANPGLVTVLGLRNEISLQPLQTGLTTIKAKTPCGGNTGPTFEVEIVNCDEETIAQLDEMMRIAKENSKRIAEDIGKIRNSKEYEKATDELAKSAGELLFKVGLTIISSDTKGTGKNIGKGVNIIKLVDAGATTRDILSAEGYNERAFNETTALMKVTGNVALEFASGVLEVADASQKFAENLSTLLSADIKLEQLSKDYTSSNNVIVDLVKRQKFCRTGTDQSKKTETQKDATDNSDLAPLTPPKKDNNQKTDKNSKGTDTQQANNSDDRQTTDKQDTDEPSDDDILIDPPFDENVKPVQVGLPYVKEECGCNNMQTIEASQQGLVNLDSGYVNLKECVDNFTAGPLADIQETLKEWQALAPKFETAVKSDTSKYKAIVAETIPVLESLLERTKSFDEAGKEFLEEFKACPESMTVGTEFLKSAFNVSIDSIYTSY